MQSIVRCQTPGCHKIVGKLETGRNVEFFCKACKKTTTVTIEATAPQTGMPAVITKEGQQQDY